MRLEYNTNDLSKILDVTTNTIRRFEEKGFLSPQRDDQNGYRIFDNSDLEKAIYIGRYRKIGFLCIAGDLLGIKVGFSCEEDREWQYVRLNLPVEKA